jgi:hypothetical protein
MTAPRESWTHLLEGHGYRVTILVETATPLTEAQRRIVADAATDLAHEWSAEHCPCCGAPCDAVTPIVLPPELMPAGHRDGDIGGEVEVCCRCLDSLEVELDGMARSADPYGYVGMRRSDFL